MYAGWDFVLWGLLLLAVFAWNLLSQALQRRRRQRAMERMQQHGDEAAPQPEPEAWGRSPQPVAPPAEAPPQPWGRSGLPLEVLAARTEPRPAPVPARSTSAVIRTRYAARFRTREDFRAAVVAMTVLGPCRALEGWQPPSGLPLAAQPTERPPTSAANPTAA